MTGRPRRSPSPPPGRAGHSDRLDRRLLAAIGLVLMTAGSYGAARGLGAFGAAESGEVVLTAGLRSMAADRRTLLLLAVAGAGLLVAFLAVRWLRAQFRRDPARRSRPVGGAGQEAVSAVPTIAPGAARKALEREIRLYPGVDRVSARVATDPPAVLLRLRTLAGCDVRALTREIDERALPMLRRLLACPDLAARLEIRLGDRPDPEALERAAAAGRRRAARR